MKRKIISIDEDKCNGCGACAEACHEGAIRMIDGKAKLISESYCDGLGACLPHCPADAITIEEREAAAFDEEYAKEYQEQKSKARAEEKQAQPEKLACGCPGSQARMLHRQEAPKTVAARAESQLRQWPCQIKLVPVNAPYFDNANLLVAADCTAYAYANFHTDFMRNRVTLIGCPKLDAVDYAEKLTEIIRQNDLKSITVLRMEVPCCGGIEHAVKRAIMDSGKMLPWQVVTISTEGEILDN
jgi:ferredoxin